MIPAIIQTLTRATAAMGAPAAPQIGKEMFWDAASGLIKERSLPPELPQNRKAPGLMDSIAGQVASGSLLSSAITSIINKIFDSFHKLTHPLETFRGGLDKFKDTITQIPQTILKAKETIVGIGSAWTEALAAPIKVVKELGDVIGQFTQLSNPAGMKLLQFKIENTFATIGNVLQPILDALTRSAEKMGDMFAKLKPAMAPAIRAIEGLIDFFATRFADSMVLIAPLIEGVSLAFASLVQNFLLIHGPISFVIRKFTEFRKSVLEFLGLPTGVNDAARSDIAVREPRYATGTEAIQRELAKNSLMASLGAPQERKDVPSLLGLILKFFEENLTTEAIIRAIRQAIRDSNPITRGIDSLTGESPIRGSGFLSATMRDHDETIAELARRRRIQTQE